MRDNSRHMIELIKTFESDGHYFAVIGKIENGVTRKYRFGVYPTGYNALRRVLQTRLFGAMAGVKHRYFFAGGRYSKPEGETVFPCTMTVRIEVQDSAKQFDFEVPRELLRNLVWWFQLQDLSEASHLAEKEF